MSDYKFELVLAGCSLLVLIFFWKEFLTLLMVAVVVLGAVAICVAPFALIMMGLIGFEKFSLARRESKSQRDESNEVRPEP